jgi:hypothetical protein
MASRNSGHRPAGGLHSRNVKHTTAPKVEPRARAMNPGGVNQLGNHIGDHATHSGKSTGYRGDPFVRRPGYNAPVGPTNMMPSGPGAGRQIFGGGSQAVHGGPAAKLAGEGRLEPGRDILGSFGPESKRS